MGKLQAKRRMKNLLMFLPNMVALCGRLLADSRVPAIDKALFAGAIVYAISPFDFIPDMIPFVGQIDDAYLIALTLLRLINHADVEVVREHWRGGGDIAQLSESVASVASIILPKGVRRVLSSRVENAPLEKRGNSLRETIKSQARLVEVVDDKQEARALN